MNHRLLSRWKRPPAVHTNRCRYCALLIHAALRRLPVPPEENGRSGWLSVAGLLLANGGRGVQRWRLGCDESRDGTG